MDRALLLFLFLCSSFLSQPVLAALVKTDELQTVIQKNFPDLKIDSLQPSAIPHFYTVTAGPMVFYISDDARYMVTGDVLDLTQNKKNITESARNAAVLKAIDHLEASGYHPIWYKAKNPKYTITVFTDITCGYCRKFHRHIPELNEAGISVRYMAFPRHGVSTPAYDRVVSIWCSDDPAQALTEAKNGGSILSKDCLHHPVQKQYELGLMAGITGTPTIILPSGAIVPGYVEPAALLKLIQNK